MMQTPIYGPPKINFDDFMKETGELVDKLNIITKVDTIPVKLSGSKPEESRIINNCKQCENIEEELLELIKFACNRARQHNHDYNLSSGNSVNSSYHRWGYNFLHEEAVMYITELVGILQRYRHRVEEK